MTTITIAIEGNKDMTWADVRDLIHTHTPTTPTLRISSPLSGDISTQTRWGTLSITQEFSAADIVADALRERYPLIVDTDSGEIVLYGQELADVFETLAPGEGFKIVRQGTAPTNANVAHVLHTMGDLIAGEGLYSEQSWKHSEYTRGLVETVKNMYVNVLFNGMDTGADQTNDFAEAYIRAAKQD